MPCLLGPRFSRQRELTMAMIVRRVLSPSTKLVAFRGLAEGTQLTSLGETPKLGQVEKRELYEALDCIVAHRQWIERKLARRHRSDCCRVLYDLTCSYYTGSHCPLAEFGYKRDGKRVFFR
jgi:hypothetical protein